MSIQSITVPAGTPIYIPSNATVLSVSYSDVATVTSTCLDITPAPQICARFFWDLDIGDGNSFGPTDGCIITSLVIKGTSFPINHQLTNNDGNNIIKPSNGFMDLGGVTNSILTVNTNSNARIEVALDFRMPQSYVNNIELRLDFATGRYRNGLFLKPSIETCP
jgi:hypothetical protein